ncbi:aspartate/glutamate racemase family protein [Pseudogemmobacter sonorensis]|uniref:aspartate/glutamate racemase family protein n=1 Tax=Pseudogemmobacter sonorensis TaxID=2989681 RepID=UPI00367C829C
MSNYSIRRNTQSWYGEDIGILILDAAYPCVPGNVGNATSFPFPVRYEEVQGASIDRLLNQRDPALEAVFVKAAMALEARGVRAISGACGFMALFQKEVAAAVSIPVGLSSLIQIPMIHALCGGAVGIITANAGQLTDHHFAGCSVPEHIPRVIYGMEDSPEFRTAILEEKGTLDSAAIEIEVLAVVKRMQAETADVRAILLECSDLPPYAAAIQAATGLPVFDFNTLIRYLRDAARQQSYTGYL